MKYEDALAAWGQSFLGCSWCGKEKFVGADQVRVVMDFDEGYACCGGTDPNCCCSMVESPRAEVVVSGQCTTCLRLVIHTIGASEFDFVRVLRAIVEAGGGAVTV